MKPLRWHDYVTINLFWLGLNVRNTAVGAILLPYLVDGFVRPEVKNGALGAIRAASLVVAMVVQPAAGLLSDRSNSPFGRRRPFILLGTLLDLAFLTAIGLSRSYGALLAAVLLLQFSANSSHGPLQGLIPDLVPDAQRGRAAAVKAVFELLPIILVALTVARLVSMGQMSRAIALTGGALLLTMLLTAWLVKEEPLRAKPSAPLGPLLLRVLGVLGGILVGALAGSAAGALLGGLTGLAAWLLLGPDTARVLGAAMGGLVAMVVAVVAGVWAGTLSALGREAPRRSAFSRWVANRLMFLAAVTSIQSFAPFFLRQVFDLTREGAAGLTGNLMIAVGAFTVVSAMPSGWLADRVGAASLVRVGGVLAAAGTGLLLATTVFPRVPLVYLAGSTIGLGAGLFMTANWTLGTALVPAGEAGRYLGVSNLAGAGAGMIGAGIGGPLADYVNRYQAGLGYVTIFACYALMFLLSITLLRQIDGRPLPAQRAGTHAPIGKPINE